MFGEQTNKQTHRHTHTHTHTQTHTHTHTHAHTHTHTYNLYTVAGSLVLSRPGARLVSRVAASLLVGVGMHATLLVRTWDDYEAVLFQLLRSRKKMWFLRQQLRAERHRAPMFATLAFKHHLLRAAGLAFDSAAATDASTARENRAKIDRAKLPHLLVRCGAHPAG